MFLAKSWTEYYENQGFEKGVAEGRAEGIIECEIKALQAQIESL